MKQRILFTLHTHTFLTVDSPKYLNSTILYTSNFLKQRRWATNRPFLLSAATRYANGLMCCFLFEPCKYHRPAVKWRTRSKTGGTLIMGKKKYAICMYIIHNINYTRLKAWGNEQKAPLDLMGKCGHQATTSMRHHPRPPLPILQPASIMPNCKEHQRMKVWQVISIIYSIVIC